MLDPTSNPCLSTCVSSAQNSHKHCKLTQKVILPAKLDAKNTFLNSWKSTTQAVWRQEVKVTLWTATFQKRSCSLNIHAEYSLVRFGSHLDRACFIKRCKKITIMLEKWIARIFTVLLLSTFYLVHITQEKPHKTSISSNLKFLSGITFLISVTFLF